DAEAVPITTTTSIPDTIPVTSPIAFDRASVRRVKSATFTANVIQLAAIARTAITNILGVAGGDVKYGPHVPTSRRLQIRNIVRNTTITGAPYTTSNLMLW